MVGKMFINYRTLKLIFFVIIGCFSELVIWAAVTSMGEINARGDDRGIVPTSSNVELIFTLNIDRSRAEPGEEIKTIEITIPPGFTIAVNDVISVMREQTELDVRPEVVGSILRIVLVKEIGDFSSSLYQVVLRSKTPDAIIQTAKFKVILRNLQDIAIGEYIKPGNADGRPNNNDFSLQIIPNIPPDPIINFEAKVDDNGENDVYLSWRPSKDQDVTGYFIYRGAEEEILMTLNGRETKQTIDINVPVGSHRYSIRAFKSQLLKSMASQSQVITVSVDTAEPLPIINLTIQTFGETVKLIWVSSPSRDVKKYQILRDEILVPDGEILADSKKKEYEFDYQYRLPKGITIYSVLALDEVGNKSKSTTQTIRIFEKPYPNPFTPLSDNPDFNKISFPKRALKNVEGQFSVSIFNLNGTLVRTLTADALATKLEWDGKNEAGSIVESGIYVYQVKVGDVFSTGTVVLAK